MNIKFRFLNIFLALNLVVGALAFAPVAPAHAATLTVNTLTDENDHSCTDADCSLRDALEVAVSDDTINFSVTGEIDLSSQLVVGKDITIDGPGSGNLTLYQTDASSRIILLDTGVWTVSISGLTIQNGNVTGSGGGIYNISSNLTLDDVVIQDNAATASGGGIYNTYSVPSVTVTNSAFSGNSALEGGGFYAGGTTTVNMTNVQFTNNSAAYGGGITVAYNPPNTGTITLDKITMTQNTASQEVGGLYLDGMNTTVTNSVFYDNSAAQDSGAIGIGHSATYTFNNVTISGNQTTDSASSGGGIEIFTGATLNLNNSTIVGNTAGTSGGGGIFIFNGTLNMNNTILANNTATAGGQDCSGSITSGDYNLVKSTGSCTLPGGVTHTITASDPMLNALADNGGSTMTHSLQVGSPILDAGDDATCESTDQRGVARPQGAHCEIGAFEDEHPIVGSIALADPNPTALSSVDFTVTFSEPVSGVDSFDFDIVPSGGISGASITNFSGADDTYTVTVDTGLGNGTLGLTLVDDDSITDNVGNKLGGTGTGNGDFTGDVYSVSKTAPAPQLPADGAALNNRRPFFDWSDFANAKGYQLQVSKSPSFGTKILSASLTGATNSQYTPTKDLPANTTLYWRVRGKLGSTKYTAWSSVFSFHTGNPPSVPSLLSPANGALLTNLSPTLDWADSTVPAGTSFDHYQLQVDDNSDFSSPLVDQNIGGVTSSFRTIGPLSTNTKYYWHVRAWNTSGEYSGWSLMRSFRESMVTPVLISPIGGVTVGSLMPTFDWDDVPGATGYTIQVSLKSNFSTLVFSVTLKKPTSMYAATKSLLSLKTYYWRVRANGPNGPTPWTVDTFMTP